MAKRSLILTSTSNQGKKLQKTITDINPNAGAVALKGFAQKLNAMTTNTYVQTDCIDKFNVDTEIPPADTRQTPTLAIPNPPTLAQVQTTQSAAIQNLLVTYTGDGAVYLKRISGCSLMDFAVFYNHVTNETYLSFTGGQTNTTGGKYVLGATGTQNYKPIEVEYTLA